MKATHFLLATLAVAAFIVTANANHARRKSVKCQANDGSFCRFNDDCCSGLCTTFKFVNVSCVENVPQNHVADAFELAPPIPDFKPQKFDGMQRWQDKVAVVTGAASGIGFSIAKRLCNDGMQVVGFDMNKAGVEKVAASCPAGRYYAYTGDLRNEQDIINLFQFVNKTLGRVDVLASNAGVTRITSLLNASTEAVKTSFDVNVVAAILSVRETLNLMHSRNITTGYIIFTNLIHGTKIDQAAPGGEAPEFYVYEATKHALKIVREGIRQELRAGKSKIRVGEISPGSVITNIPDSHIPHDSSTSEADAKKILAAGASVNKLARLSPDDVVEAFVYMLAAPERMDVNTILINNNLP